MTNAWTGGQYSLYRALFGAFLFIRLASGMGSADSIDQAVGLLAGAGASLALAIGMRDRIAAILLVPILLLFSPQCPSRTSSETMADPASLILIALLLALVPAPLDHVHDHGAQRLRPAARLPVATPGIAGVHPCTARPPPLRQGAQPPL